MYISGETNNGVNRRKVFEEAYDEVVASSNKEKSAKKGGKGKLTGKTKAMALAARHL